MDLHKVLLPFRKYHFPDINKIPEHKREFVLRVNADILQRKYRIDMHKCLCGSEDFDLIASVDNHGFITPVSVCQNCGLVSINPGYSDIFYSDILDSDMYFQIFYKIGNAKEYALANFTPIAGKYIYDSVKRYLNITQQTKVLEIEARAGWNLLPFRQVGAQVLGIERNEELAQWGKKMGFDLINTSLDKFEYSQKFNLIILSNVVEKKKNPINYVLKAVEFLEDNGIMFIEVPLYTPTKVDFYLNTQYYFTKDTFRYFFAEANLIPLETRIWNNHILGVFRKGIYTNSKFLLQRNQKDTYKAINRIKLFDYLTFSKRIKSKDDVEVFKFLQWED